MSIGIIKIMWCSCLFQQLATLMITRQVIGNIREALVPYVLWKMKLMKVGYNITGHMSPDTLKKEIKGKKSYMLCTTEDKWYVKN